MSVTDAIWRFFSEPVEEQEPARTPDTVEQPVDAQPVDTETLTADVDEYEWTKRRERLDEQYWPFEFTPDDESEKVGASETLINGTESDGGKQPYAGQWVREMLEAHDDRDDENTWVGYTRDNVRGVREAGIEYNSLFRHMAFFGMTGYGKSTVLKNLMLQWAYMGHGFCFIDPKGEDILDLLQVLPADRLDDVVWVEPGNEELDTSVGFNFFDTRLDPGDPGFESEVQNVVEDLVSILKNDGSWGATMESVSKAVATQLVRAQEENFTIVDMYRIIAEEEEREAFVDSEMGDELEQVYLKRLKNYDDDEFDPLLRRIKDWVNNRVTREMIAHEKSSVNISEIVEDGKIMLVRTSSIPSSNATRMVATTIIRRIWAAIQARADLETDDYSPYFVVMDEFNELTNGEMDIEEMFSKGRSLRLSLCVANQYPSQLDDDVQQALNNCENLFTFNPGQNNIADAKDLASTFDTEIPDLIELDMFSLLGRFSVDGEKTDAILVDSFPEYPPRRSRTVAEAIKERSIRNYGAERLAGDTDWNNYGMVNREPKAEDDKSQTFDVGADDTIRADQVLEAIHTAGVRNETERIGQKSGYTGIEDIRTEVSKYTSSVNDGVALDNIMEQLPAAHVESATKGESAYYRLTPDGEQQAFVQDSGQSSSAGKAGHRELLKNGYEAFTQLGYDVTIPEQEGEMPDGVATPPIQPMADSDSFEEAEKLKTKLERKYDRLFELFNDGTVSLEAESTTITKPKQTIKNLAKAKRNGQKCAFLVKDGAESRGTFEYWARAGHRILSDPPLVSFEDSDGNRRFYNHTTDNPVRLKNDKFALRKTSSKDTVWRDDGDRIVLEDPDNLVESQSGVVYTYTYSKDGHIILKDPDGNEYKTRFPSWSALTASGKFEEREEPLAVFKDASNLETPSKTKFPYNYTYDQSDKEYVVSTANGSTVRAFENKDDMLEEYDIIPQPVIPENLFPSGKYPTTDDWQFIIMPDTGKNVGPQVYHGEDETGDSIIEPLFDGDDPYNAIRHETDEPEETQLPDPPEFDDGDNEDTVPIATDTKPSTNDVVKSDDSTWTKPEPGDEDYDPTKDGQKFVKSHKHGNSGDWDGGRARATDDGDMADYTPPTAETNTAPTDEDTTSETEATDDAAPSFDSIRKKRMSLKKKQRDRRSEQEADD